MKAEKRLGQGLYIEKWELYFWKWRTYKSTAEEYSVVEGGQ